MSYTMLLIIQDNITVGYAVAQLVKVLRYKPKGRGFDSRWCHWYNSSGRIVASWQKCDGRALYLRYEENKIFHSTTLSVDEFTYRLWQTKEWVWNTNWMILTGDIEVVGDKPVPMPLCAPQIRHGLTRDWTLATAIMWRLTDLIS